MDKRMRQRGMALVVALVITLIIGLIAVAVVKSALQNQQNASGEFDTLASYTMAQSGMNAAERLFRNTVVADKSQIYSDAEHTISTAIDGDPEWWRDVANWGSDTREASDMTASTPRYRIEQRQFAPLSADLEEKNGRQFFRVTSRGEGPGGSISILQSYISVLTQKQE